MRNQHFSMEITKNSTFPLISRPMRKCCSSTRNIDGFGRHFHVLEQKVWFSHFLLQKCIFSLFTSKVHFSHFLAQKSTFCPKSDFGRQSAIWELREPPAGSRDRPRREPRGGVPGDPSESGPGEKTFETKAKVQDTPQVEHTYN